MAPHASAFDGEDITSARQAALVIKEALYHSRLRIPVLPDSARNVLALAMRQEVPVNLLEAAIGGDAMLAARVVQVANSPLYAFRGEVTSIKQAALRLGRDVLRDVLLQAVAEAALFGGAGGRQLQIERRHSIVVAHMTRYLGAMLGADPEHAFMCGLFHDIGRPLLLQLVHDPNSPTIPPEFVSGVLDLLHVLVGEQTARLWNMPNTVITVARHHHVAHTREDFASDVEEENRLLVTVTAADRIAYHLGEGSKDLPGTLQDDPIWDVVGLPRSRRDEIEHYARELVEAL